MYKTYLVCVFRVMLLVVPCLVAMVVDQSNQLGINKTWLQHHTRVILLHNSRVWGVLVSMNCSSLWSARRIREILHCARDLMMCSGNANLEMVRSVQFNLLFFTWDDIVSIYLLCI